MRRANEMSNRRKAAIILAVIGPERASKVIRHLGEDQVEVLTLEMARIERVSPDVRAQVIQEFHELAEAQDFIAEGGVDNARKVLEGAFGSAKAEEIIKRIVNAMQVVPFEFLKRSDPQQLMGFIQDEHPQTIALILAYIPVNLAASVLSMLVPDLRGEVAERIAAMDQTPPEVIRAVEKVLERKMSNILNVEMAKAGGPKALVDLLNRVDRSTERFIVEALSESNPELAEEVKNMMFVFEDIITLDDRAIQSVLKEVDLKELGLALKSVNDEVRDKIFKNMSERAVNMLKEDMEFMGPVKMRSVEEAQQKIVAVIRRLEEAGEINVGRGGDDDVLV